MTCRNCFKFSDCLEWESTKYYGLDACCNNVESVCEDFKNKADFVEVKHGKWIEDIKTIGTPAGINIEAALVGYKCSECGRTEFNKEPYCNCGAKMDGGS